MNQEFCSKSDVNCDSEISKKCYNGKYLSKPILNSSLRHKNQIEHLKKTKIVSEKSELDINKQKVQSF